MLFILTYACDGVAVFSVSMQSLMVKLSTVSDIHVDSEGDAVDDLVGLPVLDVDNVTTTILKNPAPTKKMNQCQHLSWPSLK